MQLETRLETCLQWLLQSFQPEETEQLITMLANFRNWQNQCLKGSPVYGSWKRQMWRWSMCSCSTKTWNVIQFNLIKGTGPRSVECNLIQINKMDWVYPLGPAASHSDAISHSENAAVSFAPKSPT